MCVCVCVCVRARVFVKNEDINLYNDKGMTEVLPTLSHGNSYIFYEVANLCEFV